MIARNMHFENYYIDKIKNTLFLLLSNVFIKNCYI